MTIDPQLQIRRVLERERFNKYIGDGALAELIFESLEEYIYKENHG